MLLIYILLLSYIIGLYHASAESLNGQMHAVTNSKSGKISKSIRIALSVDDQSYKDFLIVMQSILSSAENPSKLVFHIVACAKDIESAIVLQNQISNAIKSCFPPSLKYYSVPFTLPPQSGFYAQLKAGDLSMSKSLS